MTLLFNQGTVAATNGGTTITFTGAGLLPPHAQHGDEIVIGGYKGYLDTVDHVAQTATIKPPYDGTTGSGKTYTIRRATPISVSASEALERTFKLLNDLSVFDSEGVGLLYSFDSTAIALQKMWVNNANPALVTEIKLSTTDGKGKDVSGILGVWRRATVLIIRAVETASFGAYTLTGVPVIASGVATIPVEYVAHDGYFVSNEPLVVGFTQGVEVATPTSHSFTTNGTTGPFTLPLAPTSKFHTILNVNGAVQLYSNYSITGNQLTFTSAPANGLAANILMLSSTVIGEPSDESVGASKIKASDIAAIRTKIDVDSKAEVTTKVNTRQPLDSDLTAIAALSTQTFGRSLLTSASESALRTTLDVPQFSEIIVHPQGRLTLTSGTPVTESDVADTNTIYYTPYIGNRVPVVVGVTIRSSYFTELSLVLGTGHLADTVYDLFIANMGGVKQLVSGAAWSSATDRGTGVGALDTLDGVLVNKNNVTVRTGPLGGDSFVATAKTLVYVGTFRTSATGQTSDTKQRRLLFNGYNQVARPLVVNDTASTWSYTATAFRQANANVNNRFEVVNGLAGSITRANVIAVASNSTTTPRAAVVGIGIDSTTVNSAAISGTNYCSSVHFSSIYAMYEGYVGLGYHAVNWLERGVNLDALTWYGTSAGASASKPGMAGSHMA